MSEGEKPAGADGGQDSQQQGGGEAGGGWTGWLGTVVQTAKDKSSQAMEFIKHDLEEFQSETSRVLSGCAHVVEDKLKPEKRTVAGQKVKEGVTKLWGDFSNMMYTPPDDEADDVGIRVPSFDRFKSRLYMVQADPDTYTQEPSGSPEQYEMWRDSCDLELRKSDISELLVSRPEVRALYTRLVPAQISHADFWCRYFYKVHQLEQDEARKLMLVRRADLAKQDLDDNGDDWDDLTGTSPPSDSAMPQNLKAASEVPTPTPAVAAPTTSSEAQRDVTSAASREEPQTAPTDSATPSSQTPSRETPVAKEVSVAKEAPAASSVAAEVAKENPAVAKESPAVAKESDVQSRELKVKDKGDMVVVGSSSTSSASQKHEEEEEEDWEKEFDIEVTEEDMKLAEAAAEKLALGEQEEDDWENWE